ncbi:hypothetical protein KEM60_00870 [Austwickia sp. TVS 96-490-7B]|uniref:hypothetical protein n=1 Tax=Austwickia sp. TVS 96-490-7B TaxID=2830843 RepID=UPI001C5A242F|nr:hypothetical protein [Austwickia sp. TVS 96-490-7B]MBW3084681.1 hypothetical protein [Austwickia sp. TVS 96-490-7B]
MNAALPSPAPHPSDPVPGWGDRFFHRSPRLWKAWYVLPIAVAYGLLSWIPIGYLTRKSQNPRGMGKLSVPFWGVELSVLCGVVGFLVVWLALMSPWAQRLERRHPRVVTAACLVGMVVVLLLAYDVYRTYVAHYAPVTDRATALQYGWEELAAGRNPYYRHTQLDNTISPMVGGLVLAGPFVLTHGDMYWQGMVWLVITLAFVTWLCGPRAGVVVGSLMIFSPTVRLEVAIQSDGWINGAALVIFTTGLYLLAGRYRRSTWWTAAYLLMAVLFALAFSYRFIYAVIALPLAVLLWRHHGLRAMLTAAIPAAVLSGLLIFVPYLLDPDVYAPFQKADLGTTANTVPHLPLITGVACVIATVVGTLVMRTMSGLWGTMFAVSMVFITLTGWGQHEWYQYLTYAYSGAAFLFVLMAMVLPLRLPAEVSEKRSLATEMWERLQQRRTGGQESATRG